MKNDLGVVSRIPARLAMLLRLALVVGVTARAADSAIASRIAEVDGLKLHYLTAGQGP